MPEQNHYIYEFGPFHLDATRRVLLKHGEAVKLFPKEFDTLLALVEHNGEILNKGDLMRRVWQDTIVEESNLTSNISHLRKLLGENRGRHDYIVTVPGRGYSFVARVRQAFDQAIIRERARFMVEEKERNKNSADYLVVERPISVAQIATGKANAVTSPVTKPIVDRRPVWSWLAAGEITWHTRGALLVLATVIVAAAVLAGYSYRTSRTQMITSVAVLPFANVDGDPNAEYLSDGISESLINSLSELPQLKVIARSSAFKYKGKEIDPQEVARALGVQAVVTGRIWQHGDQLRVSVEMIDAREKTQLWGEQYSRKASDVQAVQEEITRTISAKLRLRLSGNRASVIKFDTLPIRTVKSKT